MFVHVAKQNVTRRKKWGKKKTTEKTDKKNHSRSSQINGLLLLHLLFASCTMHYFMEKYLSAAVANELGKFTSTLKLDDPQLVSSGLSTSMKCESK